MLRAALIMKYDLILALLSVMTFGGDCVHSYEPQISYFDGASYADSCRSKLERRISALSGLLISHQLYGSVRYNASKNCFLLITAPVGYRIRLRVLDFNVLGDAHNCDKDTLHVFDHEKAIDSQALHEGGSQEDTSPGPILGQFCGSIRNASELAVSTENALTLWWHTDGQLPLYHNGEGFRLLWSAFRKSNTAPCNSQREFTCKNQECIPAELACNRYPDCKDESDLSRERQIAHKCDFVEDDPLAALTGFTLLLICMGAVSLCACMCICACICCRCILHAPEKPCSATTASATAAEPDVCFADCDQHPVPPAFYPPLPPPLTPPSISITHQTQGAPSATLSNTESWIKRELLPKLDYSGKRDLKYSQVLIESNEYGATPAQLRGGEYTYVKNNPHNLLI